MIFSWQYVTDKPAGGFLHIVGEEVEESKFDINMKMYAKKLDKKDFFGKVTDNVQILKMFTIIIIPEVLAY